MKNNLKISRLAIVCVLCTAVSGAYGASSVRALGGSGTYTSAASATTANDTSNTSVRGGSLRVTPSSGVSGTGTTINAGTTTSGRVATTPRLSIGHYLGGGTSVSGGSSLRPQNPGTSGGSSSGGSSSGGMDPEVSGVIMDSIDDLQRDVETLYDADMNLADQMETKQDLLYPASDGYIIIDDNNEIFVDVDALTETIESVAGEDGREVELGSDNDNLLWRYVGDGSWNILISKDEITGPQGPQGEPGQAANIDEIMAEMNEVIDAAVEGLVTTEELEAKLAPYAMKVAVQTAIETATADLASKTDLSELATKEELAGYVSDADLTNYPTTTEMHDWVARGLKDKADKATTLQGYGITDAYTKNEVYNKGEVDGMVEDLVAGDVEGALVGKEDKSNKIQEITAESTADQYPSAVAVRTALDAKADSTTVEQIEQNVTNIQQDVTDVQQDITEVQQNITTVQENVENVTTNVTNITNQVTEITNPETGLASKVDDAVAAAGEASTKVDEMQATVGELGTAVGGLEMVVGNDESGLVADVAGAVETANDASAKVDVMQTTVGELETSVGALETTVGDENSGLVKDVADANAAATAAQEAAEEAVAGLEGKQDALGFVPEDSANRATAITAENQASETNYPSVGAIVNWTNEKINKLSDTGLPVNPDSIGSGAINNDKLASDAVTEDKIADDAVGTDQIKDDAVTADQIAPDAVGNEQIADGAVTTDKLGQDVQTALDGKVDESELGALAKKNQIADADVADNAAIAKSKLAEDVQTALDNAANAVSMTGATPNSVLGTDASGEKVWYAIVE